ncbi:ATPase [Blastomyces silverae]|uniref:ATPase n=1 Tax=Blastomyces silverae TaxID=2060906 RepID=A0A0H1B717_9EURO|nr:ATPase [Blastomyces silverae]
MLLIIVKRPRTCPLLMLVYFTAVLVVRLPFVPFADRSNALDGVARYASVVAAGTASVTILLMPFRLASAISGDISPVGQQPDSTQRSPEDNLRLWQFLSVSWMAPLIAAGKRRQLNEEDVWFLPFEFQHHRLHERFRRLKGSVLSRVLQANGIDLLILTLIWFVRTTCDFSSPLLLQKLLQVTKDPAIPKRIPLTYAFLTMMMRVVGAQVQVLNLWYGRRCYERSRGEMIMMVYEKALSRKNVSGQKLQAESSEATRETDEPPGEYVDDAKKSAKKTRAAWWNPFKSSRTCDAGTESNEAASMGKILNLIQGDVYEISQRFWEFDSLLDAPLGLIIAILLVWNLLGPSCLLGIVTVLVAQVLNAFITRMLLRWEKVRRKATDSRLQITSQFVEAIRHLRWYGWHKHWLNQVADARKHELRLRIITGVWGIMLSVVSALSSGLFPVVALYSYTVLARQQLSIDIIFPALQLFTMLEIRIQLIPSLITIFINASVALGRIEHFMAEPDKETDPSDDSVDSGPIQLESCSYVWPGTDSPVLSDLSVTIPEGLTVVSGKVGSGKTAFLLALLGEMDKTTGISHIPNRMTGYCAQTPWLQSMSIRDNILFSLPYDERRYKQVLDACCLGQDLASFKHGDLTLIGENGTGLSGGQKARAALARAVYSSAELLLLDDPLSALDFNTAEAVVRKCLSGPLMQNRTVVLVTHRTTLVHNLAQQIISIDDGRATTYDKEYIRSMLIGDNTRTGTRTDDTMQAGPESPVDELSETVPDKFIEEEHRAKGGVKGSVYWGYIKAGKLRWWALLIVVLTVYRLSAVGRSWFLKDWGEAYEKEQVLMRFMGSNHGMSSVYRSQSQSLPGVEAFILPTTPSDTFPRPADDVRPWLWAFLAITTLQTINLLLASLVMVVIVYYASKTMFTRAMERVSLATFRYFDVTPVGRLMNRLTSDIGVVDGNISQQFRLFSFMAITWVTSVVVIASVTPSFLAFTVVLTGTFVYIFLQFFPSSQSLRRLEMVSLSPLMSNFGELLHGLTTVRAFHAEKRFMDRVIGVVDKFQGMDHFYWSLQAWLTYRFQSLSAMSIFCLTMLALYTGISAGMIAFVLVAADGFVESTKGLCRQYGQIQMDFVSVERVDELCHVEQEPCGSIDPPAAWPRFGSDIVFENATVRYAPHLDPSLLNISLRIPGGSSTAVMGRTGSGKSTLALSLLSVVRPDSGRILIDNIDIAKVHTQALRQRVTFVAQEPVLFPGSIRLNLDPVGDYSDAECADVLRRVCQNQNRHGWTLDTEVEAGGRNLSHGQRQLIGLSRAVLRRSPIVILDEATASIDHESSLEIQQIIREELRESTVVTIAHRLDAIKDAEYYVVLEDGKLARHGYVAGAGAGAGVSE